MKAVAEPGRLASSGYTKLELRSWWYVRRQPRGLKPSRRMPAIKEGLGSK